MYYIVRVLIKLMDILELLILVRVILSWIRIEYNEIVRIIYQITEPMLAPFRELQQRLFSGFFLDFSPVFALMIIQFVKRLLYGMLF